MPLSCPKCGTENLTATKHGGMYVEFTCANCSVSWMGLDLGQYDFAKDAPPVLPAPVVEPQKSPAPDYSRAFEVATQISRGE